MVSPGPVWVTKDSCLKNKGGRRKRERRKKREGMEEEKREVKLDGDDILWYCMVSQPQQM